MTCVLKKVIVLLFLMLVSSLCPAQKQLVLEKIENGKKVAAGQR